MSKDKILLNLKHLYEGSTKNVYKSVILGKAAAGVTLDADLERESLEITTQLRIILSTPLMAAHPLSAHPRVPEAVQRAVARAVLAMTAAPAAKALLPPVRLTDPVPADFDADYRHLESVDIETLSTNE